METEHPLHILSLRIVNFLGVEDVTIAADGHSVVFEGENALGKTSRLKAVETLFRGASDRGVRGNLVMTGKDRAELFAEIGSHPLGGARTVEVTLHRSIPREGKQESELKARGGVPIKKVQEFLDEAVDALQMNPVAFALEPDNRKKRELVLRALPIRIESREQLLAELEAHSFEGEDALTFVRMVASGITTRHAFDVYADLFKLAYDTRADVNRDIKSSTEIIRGLDEAAPSVIYDAVQHAGALAAHTAREEAEKAAASVRARINGVDQELERIRVRLEEIEQEKKKLIGERNTLGAERTAAVPHLELLEQKLGTMPSAEVLRTDVTKWQDAHAVSESRARTVARREEQATKLAGLQLREQALTRAVNLLRDTLPDEAVKRAKVPIEGLRVTKEGVEIGGRSIEHLSTREQLEVGVQLAVALMPPTGFRLLCVDRLESLDAKSRARLRELAQGLELQIFGTKVTDAEQLEEHAL